MLPTHTDGFLSPVVVNIVVVRKKSRSEISRVAPVCTSGAGIPRALAWGIIELVLDVVFDWWDGVQLRRVARPPCRGAAGSF